MRVDRIALIVGIDDYKLQDSSLKGCIHDAINMKKILQAHSNGAPNFDCTKTYTSDDTNISREFLLEETESFFNLQAQVALFYFSGHGFLNNLGGFLVTQDARAYSEGVKMDDVLILAAQARREQRIQEIVIILDCCHSGAFGQIPLLNRGSVLEEGISILAASSPLENAVEINGHGRFTRLITNALLGGASDFCGEVKVPAIYAYIDDALSPVEQRPIFKSNVSKLISIRDSELDVESSILRFLPRYFKKVSDKIQIDESYLSGNKRSDPKKIEEFFHFLLLQDRQLILPKESLDLSDAARKSDIISLTEIGKYYWNIVMEKKLLDDLKKSKK